MNRTQIDIPTAQNVIITYPLASYGERLLAMIIDGLIYGTAVSFFTAGMALLFEQLGLGSWFLMLLQLAPFILMVAYFSISEVMNKGRTIGKMALNIKVMKTDGGDLKWTDMVLRATCLFPDLLFSFGVVGSILINTNPKRQRLGDIAAGTVVVKAAGSNSSIWLRDLLSIQTLTEYTPMYPQVRNLTEKDMVFIKSVILRTERYQNVAHQNAALDLSEHLREVLQIEKMPANRLDFLRTLLRDYVVLTR